MLTLVCVLQRTLVQSPDRIAVIEPDRRRTWREVGDRIARAATVLADLGVRAGDTFAIVSRNSARCFELMHAGYWSGAIPVPINHRLAPPEMAAILAHARCRRVLVERDFAVAFDHAPLAAWQDRLVRINVNERGRGSDHRDDDAAVIESMLEQAAPAAAIDAAETDTAILLYTGGTTGAAKGVALTHRNVVSNALQVTSCVHFDADDVYLHMAPMFHSADLLGTGVTLQGGAHAFLPQFEPTAFAAAVVAFAVTRTMLAPAMVQAILASETGRAGEFASLRQLFYGSSPMAETAIRSAFERFRGVEITQGYGLTETSPLLTLLSAQAHREALQPGGPVERLKSAGRALPGVDLRIVDEAGATRPAGEAGEVWVRGPNVAGRYLDSPEESALAFHDGWFRTGDVGRLDDEGYLTLLDRRKDMIITGGENVYSVEVEAVLALHPSVQDAAVIGVPDERFGEALLAVIVCHPGRTLELDEMIAHCRQHIGGYKIPRRLRLVEAMPRSALGKVLKSRLRAQ